MLGDPVYGRTTPARLAALPPPRREAVKALGGQALHAYVIGFDHPATGERIRIDNASTQTFQKVNGNPRGTLNFAAETYVTLV